MPLLGTHLGRCLYATVTSSLVLGPKYIRRTVTHPYNGRLVLGSVGITCVPADRKTVHRNVWRNGQDFEYDALQRPPGRRQRSYRTGKSRVILRVCFVMEMSYLTCCGFCLLPKPVMILCPEEVSEPEERGTFSVAPTIASPVAMCCPRLQAAVVLKSSGASPSKAMGTQTALTPGMDGPVSNQ